MENIISGMLKTLFFEAEREMQTLCIPFLFFSRSWTKLGDSDHPPPQSNFSTLLSSFHYILKWMTGSLTSTFPLLVFLEISFPFSFPFPFSRFHVIIKYFQFFHLDNNFLSFATLLPSRGFGFGCFMENSIFLENILIILLFI